MNKSKMSVQQRKYFVERISKTINEQSCAIIHVYEPDRDVQNLCNSYQYQKHHFFAHYYSYKF